MDDNEWLKRFKRRRRIWIRIRNMTYALAITFYIAVLVYAIRSYIL